MNTNALKALLLQLNNKLVTNKKLSKKRYHFQLASNEDSYRLTGYQHNAIAPLAFTCHSNLEQYHKNDSHRNANNPIKYLYHNIPIILCKKCVDLQPLDIFLGGGKIDVKLSMSITELIRITQAVVGDVTDER